MINVPPPTKLMYFESEFLTVHFCENEKAKWVLFDLNANELEQAGRKLLTY